MSVIVSQRLLAEALGTAFLLAIVVGSGIMAERLSGGNMAIALLANTLATGAGLVALILAFSPVSSHFNPVVTLMSAVNHELPWREVPAYITVQIAGAYAGVAAAHIMFDLPIWFASTKARAGFAQAFSEFVATFGLVIVIASVARHQARAVPYAVGGYITAAYWFTASTSFANPAVTLARAASETFAGIRPQDVGMFILAQLLALVVALFIARALFAPKGKP
jgi:glycerol uptake facilitator-like aquaporin